MSPMVVHVIHLSPSGCHPILESIEIIVFLRIKTVEPAFSTGRAAQALLDMRFSCDVPR